MPIELSCSCGRALRVRDEAAGKMVRCPQCKATLQAPMPAVEAVKPAEVVEEAVAAGPPPLPPRGEEYVEVELIEDGVSAGAPPRLGGKPKASRPAPRSPAPEHTPPMEKKKKKKQSVYTEFYGESRNESETSIEESLLGESGASILGGAVLMMMSLLLLVLLLLFGVRFGRAIVWSIVLFGIGAIAVVKGVVDLCNKR